MSTIALTISNIPVRQDSFGRFCLNDLHKASGNEKRHSPNYWLETQQTKELIEELTPGIPGFLETTGNPVVSLPGRKGGTFVVKELVYAYAMWISAKFHIAVIRAYDALVTAPRNGLVELPREPLRKSQKALPGGLSLETQDEIKQLIDDRAALLPKKEQAGFVIKAWSALGSHFGVTKEKGDKTPSYKFIPEGARLECLSLIARLSVNDVVVLTHDEFEAKVQEKAQALHGELLEHKPQAVIPSITLAMPALKDNEMRRWMVTQHGEMMQLWAISVDNIEPLLQEVTRQGYIVFKKDDVGVSKLVQDFIPAQYLPMMIETAGKRLQAIQRGTNDRC